MSLKDACLNSVSRKGMRQEDAMAAVSSSSGRLLSSSAYRSGSSAQHWFSDPSWVVKHMADVHETISLEV